MLIRDKDIAEIILELIKTNHWVEIPLQKEYKEDYLQPSPRIFKRSDDTFSIKLWTEAETHFIVDAGLNTYIEVPDCEALNIVLVEENMHPDPDTNLPPISVDQPKYSHYPYQSPMRRPPTKIYIPTELLATSQLSLRNSNGWTKVVTLRLTHSLWS